MALHQNANILCWRGNKNRSKSLVQTWSRSRWIQL